MINLDDSIFAQNKLSEEEKRRQFLRSFQALWSRLAQWLTSRTTDQGVPGSTPGRGTVCCGLEQITFTHCLVLVKPRKPWTDD